MEVCGEMQIAPACVHHSRIMSGGGGFAKQACTVPCVLVEWEKVSPRNMLGALFRPFGAIGCTFG